MGDRDYRPDVRFDFDDGWILDLEMRNCKSAASSRAFRNARTDSQFNRQSGKDGRVNQHYISITNCVLGNLSNYAYS